MPSISFMSIGSREWLGPSNPESMRFLNSNKHFFVSPRGFTLMEVVIALLVTAITIPLILGALGATAQSRQDATADTTAAWIARDFRSQLLLKWEDTALSHDEDNPTTTALVLLYSKDGALLSEASQDELEDPFGFPQAFFVAAAHVAIHQPTESAAPKLPLANLSIEISYPAKASLSDRQRLYYQTISTGKGRWK